VTKAEPTISTPGFDGKAENAAPPAAADGDAAGSPAPDGTAGNGAAGARAAQPDAARPDAARTGAAEDGDALDAAARRRRIGVLLSVAAFAYALDLVSKTIVVAKLEHRAPVDLLGHYLRFEAVRNPGAAFGIGAAYTVVFGFIAVIVIAVIARIARKLYSLSWAIALGLLLGGALGNLTDRLFRAPGVLRGHVVDFIAPTHFAVFNLADSAIVCGGILIVLLSFRGSSPDGTIHKD
jgi:signal peptidase II